LRDLVGGQNPGEKQRGIGVGTHAHNRKCIRKAKGMQKNAKSEHEYKAKKSAACDVSGRICNQGVELLCKIKDENLTRQDTIDSKRQGIGDA